jgi:hypothetical protein
MRFERTCSILDEFASITKNSGLACWRPWEHYMELHGDRLVDRVDLIIDRGRVVKLRVINRRRN